MPSWTERVERYVDQLDDLVQQLSAVTDQIQVDQSKCDPQVVQAAADDLVGRLDELERKVAERDQLLKADDAPEAGITLVEKLRDSAQRPLADRCVVVGDRIADLHHRSIATFVCQYHLSNLTVDLVRLMTGADRPATYGVDEAGPPTPQGGLFNDAA